MAKWTHLKSKVLAWEKQLEQNNSISNWPEFSPYKY
jgi:hypothetical protein